MQENLQPTPNSVIPGSDEMKTDDFQKYANVLLFRVIM